MTFAAGPLPSGLEARAVAARSCTAPQERPNPFLPPATFLCAAARAINDGFWNLREAAYAWRGLRPVDRELFYFVAAEALLAAKAWREATGGETISIGDLARAISDAYWALCDEPEHRNSWDSQHENHRLTWVDCAGRVLAVAADWRKARAA